MDVLHLSFLILSKASQGRLYLHYFTKRELSMSLAPEVPLLFSATAELATLEWCPYWTKLWAHSLQDTSSTSIQTVFLSGDHQVSKVWVDRRAKEPWAVRLWSLERQFPSRGAIGTARYSMGSEEPLCPRGLRFHWGNSHATSVSYQQLYIEHLFSDTLGNTYSSPA